MSYSIVFNGKLIKKETSKRKATNFMYKHYLHRMLTGICMKTGKSVDILDELADEITDCDFNTDQVVQIITDFIENNGFKCQHNFTLAYIYEKNSIEGPFTDYHIY